MTIEENDLEQALSDALDEINGKEKTMPAIGPGSVVGMSGTSINAPRDPGIIDMLHKRSAVMQDELFHVLGRLKDLNNRMFGPSPEKEEKDYPGVPETAEGLHDRHNILDRLVQNIHAEISRLERL